MAAPRIYVLPTGDIGHLLFDTILAGLLAEPAEPPVFVSGVGEPATPRLRALVARSGRPLVQLEGGAIVHTREGRVEGDATAATIQAALRDRPERSVVLIEAGEASDSAGARHPLLPLGLDFTATLLARALAAESLCIWVVEGGVPSADPRFVSDAFVLPRLSYREASEVVYPNLGRLHPRTIVPLLDRQIPLFVGTPGGPNGTWIDRDGGEGRGMAKAVTAIETAGLIVIEGVGMMGISGIAARALGALAEARINVVMLSQAATEQSIGILVRLPDLEPALHAAQRGLSRELDRAEVQRVYALPDLGVVTVVDDHMRYRPGLTGRMFSTLGRAGINVVTMAEGASETNISAVVGARDLKRAVQSLHESFALGRQRAHVFLFGAGTVGKMLLEMMGDQAEPLLDTLNLHLQLVGLANTRGIAWDVDGIPFSEGLDRLRNASGRLDQDAITQHLIDSRLDRLIVVDATASEAITRLYPILLEHNIAVVTPNKQANTQSMAFYNRLKTAARQRDVPYFYETTVGAGLPVIGTLRDLLRSGDTIERIEGVLSGTMSYVFNELAAGRPIEQVLREAHRLGYTEPDPRDDLSGEDAARKLMILAREMGLAVEREDVDVESLVPPALAGVPLERFWAALAEGLAPLQDRSDAARANGERLHHVAGVYGSRLRVGVERVGPASPLFGLAGTDNLVAFTTRRYRQSPLVVRGPGAGPEVTAAGILADVIRAAELVT
jgi:aspartokinase/homoserine dehydrogenase 1